MSAAPSVRILGIDPGLRFTGFGVLEKTGSRLQYIASGCVSTQRKDGSEALAPRLKTILDGVREVIATYAPQQVAMEKVFVNVNPQSTLALGQARGAAICAVVDSDIELTEYTALQIKQAVAGKGNAGKEQVQEMVKRLLRLPALPGADAADALACAICHAHAGRGLGALPTRGLRLRNGRLG